MSLFDQFKEACRPISSTPNLDEFTPAQLDILMKGLNHYRLNEATEADADDIVTLHCQLLNAIQKVERIERINQN